MDLHTLFVAQTCALGATAFILWMSYSDADRSNGMRAWMTGIASQAVAYLVLSNAFGLNPVVTAAIGHFLGSFGVALFFTAIRQFVGRVPQRRELVLMVAMVTGVCAMAGKNVVVAAIFTGWVYTLYQWRNAVALWHTERAELRRIQRTIALFYGAMGTVLPLRATALLLAGTSWLSMDMSKTGQVPVYMFGFVYIIVTSLGFSLMCKTRAEADIRLQAYTDVLTGLANRRALDEETVRVLAAAQRSGRPFAVVMADIDRFKVINDELGHSAGDAVLKGFAQRLRASLRAGDRAFRYGGEEFCVLLADTDDHGAYAMAQRMSQQVALKAQGTQRAVTASFGVTAWRPGDAPDTLLGRADSALYRAKALGRDRVELAEG